MTRDEYINAFKCGTLHRPAVLPLSATMADLHQLLRELGGPRVRMAYGTPPPMDCELVVLFNHDPDAVDWYYRGRTDGEPNLLLIAESTTARMAVGL